MLCIVRLWMWMELKIMFTLKGYANIKSINWSMVRLIGLSPFKKSKFPLTLYESRMQTKSEFAISKSRVFAPFSSKKDEINRFYFLWLLSSLLPPLSPAFLCCIDKKKLCYLLSALRVDDIAGVCVIVRTE